MERESLDLWRHRFLDGGTGVGIDLGGHFRLLGNEILTKSCTICTPSFLLRYVW